MIIRQTWQPMFELQIQSVEHVVEERHVHETRHQDRFRHETKDQHAVLQPVLFTVDICFKTSFDII